MISITAIKMNSNVVSGLADYPCLVVEKLQWADYMQVRTTQALVLDGSLWQDATDFLNVRVTWSWLTNNTRFNLS